MQDPLVFVGTYTENTPSEGEKSGGIFVFRLDPADGALHLLHQTQGIINPSFLAIHPNQKWLYTVNEVTRFDGQPGGGVSAFTLDSSTGKLELLNQQPSLGADPCHVTVDQTGQCVLVANYTSGNISIFPLAADGRLLPAAQMIQHTGSSLHPLRQEGPHAHSITLDPGNRFAIVADLGLDKLFIYRLSLPQAHLTLHREVPIQAGAGPRHVDFHPNGQFVYLINELNSTMVAFAYDASAGNMTELQTVPTLPADFHGANFPADVHAAPSGKFVYGSNRLHDSLAIYAIHPEDGRLAERGHSATGGEHPRNFAIDPTGTFLLAANQHSGTVVTFRIDAQTGALHPAGQSARVPSPVCIQFLIRT